MSNSCRQADTADVEPGSPTMLRRLIVLLILFIAVVAALGAWKYYSIRQQIAFFTAPKPPIQVSATKTQSIDWQSRLPAIGTLTARQGVELTAEIAGTVERVLAESDRKSVV